MLPVVQLIDIFQNQFQWVHLIDARFLPVDNYTNTTHVMYDIEYTISNSFCTKCRGGRGLLV